METTTARPIHPTTFPAPDNGRVSQRPRPTPDDGGPVAHAIAVTIFMGGTFAACVLVCWALFRVAGLLGLLS